MNFSLNEVEATAKRATRGAGYSWGLAEDAGKAVRWLCARGIDGGAALSGVLELGLARSPGDHRPENTSGPWRAASALCPLVAGVTLADRVEALRHSPVEMQELAQPLLILPFAAIAARRLDGTLNLSCQSWSAVTDGVDLSMNGNAGAHTDHLRIEMGGVLTTKQPFHTRAAPDPAHWAVLNRFAHRTYAPATEESRRLGAGTQASDND